MNFIIDYLMSELKIEYTVHKAKYHYDIIEKWKVDKNIPL